MIDIATLQALNAPTREERLENLQKAVQTASFPEANPVYINCHIHTTYSFSPYSPAAAVFAAKAEGLCTAGIVDHDTTAGAEEFIEAGKIADMPVTVGMEARVSMQDTPLSAVHTNNPDQSGISYMTFQGIPHRNLARMNEFFAPLRAARNERTRKMVANINHLLVNSGILLDFDHDVEPLSLYREGGAITERHLMYALAKKLTAQYGRGESLVQIMPSLGVALSEKQAAQLMDTQYRFYEYDLLGILKSAFIEKIYVPATDECITIAQAAKLAEENDAIACYAYLGDVEQSVTGDKKAQKFEDAYLDQLFDVLDSCGIHAVTYMPTRNTPKQLDRLRTLCQQHHMFQVSGEDINSPRQSFVIHAMEKPQFANLVRSTWQLIDHENGTSRIEL